ncbi:MAG: histidine phosphatase family protein [Desulfobacterales bacterium]|nr:histidine phosphatase family protein [Desulfobacterales bacterium]
MREDKRLGWQTARVVQELYEQGVKRAVLFIRHSARHYSGDPQLEGFMGLTQEGKEAALAFGEMIKGPLPVSSCSSYIGRCIETAYLVRQGSGGKPCGFHELEEKLSPFYVKDFKRIIEVILQYDLFGFIRTWCDGGFSSELIEPAQKAAQAMMGYAHGLLKDGTQGLTVGVTHDWNIFALKEFAMGLPHEKWGKVEYLDGVVFFRREGALWGASYQGGALMVSEGGMPLKEETVVHV